MPDPQCSRVQSPVEALRGLAKGCDFSGPLRDTLVSRPWVGILIQSFSVTVTTEIVTNCKTCTVLYCTRWQFNRIFWPPKSWPKSSPNSSPTRSRSFLGRRPSLGGLLGSLKYLNCHPGWQFNRFFGRLNHGLNHRLTHPQPEVTHL